MKCQVCKTDEVAWSWQPFGPGNTDCFALPGSHYRGFPVIKVCESCRQDVRNGSHVEFTYRGTDYIVDYDKIRAIPEYVDDVLLWLEETQP